MYLIGLTGGIATGKSTVSKIFFEEFQCAIIDSDLIARQVVLPGKKAWKKIHEAFGSEIILENGEINRVALGNIIFNDPDKRQILNRITHPEIYKEVIWQITKYFFRGYQFVIIDTPLLFETKFWSKYVHKIIVVACEEDLQIQRLMDRNSLLESEAKVRISAQMPLREKCEKADYIIDNSGNLEDTRNSVNEIYRELKSSKLQWRIRLIVGFFGVCTGGIFGLIYWYLRRIANSETKMLLN